jgi:hypothetical protein
MGNSITVIEPYGILYHHLDQLVAYQATCPQADKIPESPSECLVENEDVCNETTCEHIQVLRDFLEGSYKAEIVEERLRHARTSAVVNYAMNDLETWGNRLHRNKWPACRLCYFSCSIYSSNI